jgi:hypothetical protein
MEPKINIFLKDEISNDPLLVAKNASDIMFYIVMGSSSIIDGVSYMGKSANETFEAWFKSYAPINSNVCPNNLFNKTVNNVTNSYDPFFISIQQEETSKNVATAAGHMVHSPLVQGVKNMAYMSENLEKIHNRKQLMHNERLPLLAINKKFESNSTGIATAAAQATAAATLHNYSPCVENFTTLDLDAWDGNYTYQQSKKGTYFTNKFRKLLETLENLGINYYLDVNKNMAVHTDPIDKHTLYFLKTFLI